MYCGIDIAKGKSQICIIDKDKKVLFEKEIEHTKEGFEELDKRLTKDIVVGMESTGNYSKTIYNFLKDKYQVYYIDNVQMNNYAKLRFLHVKNDKVDAKLIAEYLMSDFKLITPTKMDELKDLSRLYHKAMKQLVRYKKSFGSQLSIIFPELEKIVYLRKAKAVPYMLLEYPRPKDIVNATTEDIYNALVKHIDNGKYFTLEYAEKIQKCAKESVGVSDYPSSCFKHTIRLMLFYQEMIKDITKNLTECLAKTPYVKLLEKRGYGAISLAGIVGEVGDIRKYTSHKKFVKYCGFDVSEKQSGKSHSTHCFITKQGNRYLRSIFYNLVLPQLTNKDEEFYDFFRRLKDKGKHTTTCMVAVARKIAVRTYFDLTRCHETI